MNHVLKTFYFLCAGMFAAGCAGVGIADDHVRWSEEVKLSDGKIIQIQRHVELTESGFPVQRRGFNKYFEICYPPMGIHWKSKGGYQPDIFDIVDGKAYMHVPIAGCLTCERYGYPSTNALYFVWEDGRWKRIEHEEFPAASEWNLLMSFKSAAGHEKDDPRGLVSLNDKERRESFARDEQKRFGWKRVSDSYAWKGACDKCRNVKTFVYGESKDEKSIFITDSKPDCK